MSTTIIAFGASLVAETVDYTAVMTHKAELLFRCACSMKGHRAASDEMMGFVKAQLWKIALVHNWRRLDHINKSEACIEYMAIEWAVSRQISACKFVTFSDPKVVIGAFNNGRYSSPGFGWIADGSQQLSERMILMPFSCTYLASSIRQTNRPTQPRPHPSTD